MTQRGKPVLFALVRTAADAPGYEHQEVECPRCSSRRHPSPSSGPRTASRSPLLGERELPPAGRQAREAGPAIREWVRFDPTAAFEDPFLDAVRPLILLDTFGWPAVYERYRGRTTSRPTSIPASGSTGSSSYERVAARGPREPRRRRRPARRRQAGLGRGRPPGRQRWCAALLDPAPLVPGRGPARPPSPLGQPVSNRRDQQRPDDEGVEQDADRDRGPDLDELLQRQQGEGGEGAGEDQAGAGDDAAGVDERDRMPSRVPCAAASSRARVIRKML